VLQNVDETPLPKYGTWQARNFDMMMMESPVGTTSELRSHSLLPVGPRMTDKADSCGELSTAVITGKASCICGYDVTAFSAVSLTNMSGLGGEEPGRGGNITSVFFKLIVRQKRLAGSIGETDHEPLDMLKSVCHNGTVISEQELTYQSLTLR